MPRIRDVTDFLGQLAPCGLAESWDNVGMLVGDEGLPVERVMTCLTVTPESASEAVARRAELIVTHHPLPFRPLKRLTADDPTGRLLWQLMGRQIGIYSAHTAFDSATSGLNQLWADSLGLVGVAPIRPLATVSLVEQVSRSEPGRECLGAGRHGKLPQPMTLDALAEQVKSLVRCPVCAVVGPESLPVRHVAVACGSGGDFVTDVAELGCDVMITGEARFHDCLAAETAGLALILTGHFASERWAMGVLAKRLAAEFAGLEVWASQRERDPVRFV